jgi:CubicO group peptidase (beta-lactamase class C family)
VSSAFIAVIVAASHAAAQPVVGPAPENRVRAIFAEFDRPTSPGCTVAVYQGDQIVHRSAYGMANLDHDIKLTPSSIFHVASVSKQFAATAILLLAQDGKLSIDDEVRKYVPELPDFGRRITIRHLANHTSGIRDQWDLLGLAGWRYSRDLITDDDVLSLLSRQKDLNFSPGERHLYSNSGYTLMAVIVSRVSGQSFREFTTKRIFEPLGMTNTHFRDRFNEVVKNQAYGYSREGDSYRLSVTNFDTAGATSLLTTVEDLAKWHANFDRHTVGGAALQQGLLERGVLNDGKRIDYAFGVTHGTYRGVATVGHGGADAGYRAAFVRFPEQRLGVACLCNLASTNPGDLAQRVADVYLPTSLPPRSTASTADQPEVPLPASTLTRLPGLYWNEREAVAVRVAIDGERLHLVAGTNRRPLKSLGSHRFVAMEGFPTELSFDVDQRPEPQLRLRGIEDALVRVPSVAPAATELAAFAGVYRTDEMDAVFRISVSGEGLQLERLKVTPAALEPLFADAFRSPVGILRFSRNAAGRVTGFLLEGGRVRHMKFWKETAPAQPTS